MILHIKVNIELPVATRHRLDMTEKLLKATLNPNKQTYVHVFCHTQNGLLHGFCDKHCVTGYRYYIAYLYCPAVQAGRGIVFASHGGGGVACSVLSQVRYKDFFFTCSTARPTSLPAQLCC